MPVFQENAHAARDLRILPSRALPLPRRTPRPQKQAAGDEKYEVVVIGVSNLTPNASQLGSTTQTNAHRLVPLVYSSR